MATGAAPGFTLSNPFGFLESADGLASAFTNYVNGYVAPLDYIFFTKQSLQLGRFAELPREQDLCRKGDVGEGGVIITQGYLPSESFPSDHVSVVADLAFRAPPMDEAERARLVPCWPPPEDRPALPLPASRWNETKAAEELRSDRIVALPTDTLYGVAASA